MLGPNNALHATRGNQLHTRRAGLDNGSAEQLVEAEDIDGVLCGYRGVIETGVCGSAAVECYGECVVFYSYWEGG